MSAPAPHPQREEAFSKMFAHALAHAKLYASFPYSEEEAKAGLQFAAWLEANKEAAKKAVLS